MSDLSRIEMRKLEALFGMSSGYVLNFSNRTFEEFVLDSTGRSIYDEKYNQGSGSKANRLRGFWSEEGNQVVAKLLDDLIDHAESSGADAALISECRKIVARLKQDAPVQELDALTKVAEEHDFEVVGKAVRDSIDRNDPVAGLDRLHTFVTKYVRRLCEGRGIVTDRDKPLHSIFGEYVRSLRSNGEIESEMTERILKSNISVLEAFNHVRNNQSLAHDNVLLGHDEALLIFNHVASLVRFLRELERRSKQREKKREKQQHFGVDDDDVPF